MSHSLRTIRYAISPHVFERFPEYLRALVVVEKVINCPSPPELVDMLRAAEDEARVSLQGVDLANHARISAWREAYRTLGIKPTEFRPSMEAMLRRVLNGHQLPAINALVDIGNLVSLRHLLPVGGHALDSLEADVELRPAHGRELFIPFGSDQHEHPDPGEFIFSEGDIVLTRRWTWRQSARNMTTLETSTIEYNVDALPPVGRTEALAACEEILALVSRFCGGQPRLHILSRVASTVTLLE